MTQSNSSPNSFMQLNEIKSVENPKSREEVPVVECLDGPARITSKELAPIHSVQSGTLQNACSTRPRLVADLVEKCSYAHRQVDERPSKMSKKNDD